MVLSQQAVSLPPHWNGLSFSLGTVVEEILVAAVGRSQPMKSTGSPQDYHALLKAYLGQLGLEAFLQSYQSYTQDAARMVSRLI